MFEISRVCREFWNIWWLLLFWELNWTKLSENFLEIICGRFCLKYYIFNLLQTVRKKFIQIKEDCFILLKDSMLTAENLLRKYIASEELGFFGEFKYLNFCQKFSVDS